MATGALLKGLKVVDPNYLEDESVLSSEVLLMFIVLHRLCGCNRSCNANAL